MAKLNRAWNLESFLDSLIIELDKARETLAIKAINKPLTYAVKDVAMDLQLFPSFDGNQVRFVTAEPGQSGASKISIQLGSITDQQIRKTTKRPISRGDISFEVLDDIDEDTRQSLRKIGVTSVDDLEAIEKKNVDIEKASNNRVSYKKLATLLQKARRGKMPPTIMKASLSFSQGKPMLNVNGENLIIDQNFDPVAVFNGTLAEIKSANKTGLTIKLDKRRIKNRNNELIMALDPFAVVKINIDNPE